MICAREVDQPSTPHAHTFFGRTHPSCSESTILLVVVVVGQMVHVLGMFVGNPGEEGWVGEECCRWDGGNLRNCDCKLDGTGSVQKPAPLY